MFDAALLAPNGAHYFFSGVHYWKYDFIKGKTYDGYPRRIVDHWPDVPTNVDAAFRGYGSQDGKVFFVKHRKIWRYDFKDRKIDSGYPKKIEGFAKGLWSNGHDCIVDVDNIQYVLRHNRVKIRAHMNNSQAGEYADRAELFKDPDDKLKEERNENNELVRAAVTGWPVAAVRGSGDRDHKVYFFHYDLQRAPAYRDRPEQKTRVARYNMRTQKFENNYALSKAWKGFERHMPQDLYNEIAQIATDPRPTKFPGLDKYLMMGQLANRVIDPRHIQQSNIGFCGPASILFWLARTQPEKYVRAFKQLLFEGKFRLHGDTIQPSTAFMNSTPTLPVGNGARIEDIDWMMMGALRDHKGLGGDIMGTEDDVTGSNARIMQYWCDHVLGYNEIDKNASLAMQEHKSLEQCDDAFDKGGVGFMQIHSSMIKDGPIKKKNPDDGWLRNFGEKMFGNHWIVYMGDDWSDAGRWLNPNDGRFSFKAWSWGKIYHVSLSEKDFRDTMYGAVTAY